MGNSLINSGVNSVMYSVLMPKLLPRIIVDRIKSGMDIHNDIVEIGIPIRVEQTSDNPVIPPGASPVDTKNKFTASAVMAVANVIHA